MADRQPGDLAPAAIEFLNKYNPKPLILRTREGLEPSHPYYRALAMAVQSELSPLFDQVARDENALRSAGAKLTKDLNALGRSLAQLMQTALEEAELDDEIGGDGSDEPDLLALLPPIKKVKLGKVATLTVWIPDDGAGPELGNTLIIGHWGSMTIGIAILQILWGMHLDSHHDKTITRLWPLAPIYPVLYWWLEAILVVAATLPTLLTRAKTSTWSLRTPGTKKAASAREGR